MPHQIKADSYTLEIDWDGSGTFDGGGEDITADLVEATINRGFSDQIARVARTGTLDITLDNEGGDYSPPSQADVLPRREVKFSMTYNATTEVLFRGFIDAIRPDEVAGDGTHTVQIHCVDAMDLLDMHEGAIALQENVYADDVIGSAVSAVYTPPDTDYESGINYFPFAADRWGWDSQQSKVGSRIQQTRASEKIVAACMSDWGRFFIEKDGTANFTNRQTVPLDSTTELTLNDTMMSLGYEKSTQPIYNYIKVTTHPRTVGEAYEVLGRINQTEPPRIEANSSRTFVIRFRDPANNAISFGGKDLVTPVASTDFDVTVDEGGAGTNINSDITPSVTNYGNYCEVELASANGSVSYVQKLQVRGIAVRTREPVTVVDSDATSISDYQKRELTVDCKLLSRVDAALLLADYLKNYYKDPDDVITDVEFSANYNSTLMAAARDLELLDQVEISQTHLGLSSVTTHIYGLRHNIVHGDFHTVSLDLFKPYPYGCDPFYLGDALNSGHCLIY